MKYLSRLAMIAFMLMSGISLTHAELERRDLADAQDSPYADQIYDIYERGIVDGYADGSYRPKNTINRAEFTKIIMESLYTGDQRRAYLATIKIKPFRDVSLDAWFSDYVYMASGKGILKGYEDRTFGPERKINFAEGSKIIAKAFGMDTGPEHQVWYVPFIEAMLEIGALPPSYTEPAQNITRAEMAYMISMTLQDQESEDSIGTYYQDVDDLDLEDGEAKLLFFHADWCPKCRANDEKIIRWYNNVGYNISTYKVDYDREIALKDQFKVRAQDTFILLDAAGDEVDRFQFPSESKLKEALSYQG